MKTPELRGGGIGFRLAHAGALLDMDASDPRAPSWLELLADNHMNPQTERLALELAERYPIALHCVGMNLGGIDALDRGYLEKIKHLVEALDPVHVSDHLAITATDGHHHHDLWPLPHTIEAARHASERITIVQDLLRRRILVENISTYVRYPEDEMSELEFMNAILSRADCGVLLDLNNLVVNRHNHAIEDRVERSLGALDAIGYVHLAGHTRRGDLLVDTHDEPPGEEVWSAFEMLQRLAPATPSLIEWDGDLPDLSTLTALSNRAEAIMLAAERRARDVRASPRRIHDEVHRG